MTVRVGLVTVTYNSGSVLSDFLDSFASLSGVDARLYVVDNNSTDGTPERLKAIRDPKVSVILNEDNAGIAIGNNQGIEAARVDSCDWILLINNDTLFDPDFVSRLVGTASDRGLKIVSPLIAATEPPGSDWYSDGKIHAWRAMQAKHVGMGDTLRAPIGDPYVVDYASTCALLVHPSVFEAVGLMDPVYFVYGDDVDFCLRATRAGFDYHVEPRAVLVHKASSLTGEFTGPFAARWISRNWVVVARRHATKLQLLTGAVFIGAWTVARLLTRRDSLKVTRWRVAAFLEGSRVDLSVPPPRFADGPVDAL